MKKHAFVLLTAAALIGAADAASAQTFYFGFSTDPYGPGPYGPGAYGPGSYGPGAYGPGPYGPGPYYAPPPARPPYYGPPAYGGPRYYPGGSGAYRTDAQPGYYRPGRFRTWNGCQRGWTVQDGLCKPYRGY